MHWVEFVLDFGVMGTKEASLCFDAQVYSEEYITHELKGLIINIGGKKVDIIGDLSQEEKDYLVAMYDDFLLESKTD